MNITIEQLQLPELEAFLREQADDAFPSLKDEQRLHALAEKWHTYAEFCTCRDANGQLVGMIAFYANNPAEKMIYLPHVYVSSKIRKKGLFSKMLAMVEQIGQERGYNRIRLEVDKGNEVAISCYKKRGFEINCIKEQSYYLEKHFKRQYDYDRMRKDY